MARIVVLSSLVARGHVGLRAILPALEMSGHDATALPTVVLSSHAAYPQVAGIAMAPATLGQMADALEANGWLSATDVIMTGYLPSPAHVSCAAHLVSRTRALNPAVKYVCDPVLGDHPKGLYVPAETASQVRDVLVPLADLVTPNAFELAWLTGRKVDHSTDATSAAAALSRPMVLATSVPLDDGRLATLLHQKHDAPCYTAVPRRAKAPSGTGDILTGLFTGGLASGMSPASALAHAGAYLEAVLEASDTVDDLSLVPLFRSRGLTPLPIEPAT